MQRQRASPSGVSYRPVGRSPVPESHSRAAELPAIEDPSDPLSMAMKAAQMAEARENKRARPKRVAPTSKTASSLSKHAKRLADARRRQEEARLAKAEEFGS